MAAPPRAVRAAGVVAFRPGRQVLLIHRPRYDDWSFPKGKVDPGEHLAATAVREAHEETGLRVRLGRPLQEQRYPVAGRRSKVVSYWVARVVGDDDLSTYEPNPEVDEVVWCDAAKARSMLTYDHDRATLAQALAVRKTTVPVVVLRHAKARSRKSWRREDRDRPLLAVGGRQAEALVPLLSAYAARRVVTSGSARCAQTVAPYAAGEGLQVDRLPVLSEEDHTPAGVRRLVASTLEHAAAGRGSVLCSHRPVLPLLMRALRVEDPRLAPGQLLVAHVRGGRVVAHEVHSPL